MLNCLVEAQPNALINAFKLLEDLSAEGVNVSQEIDLLNKALELYAKNRSSEADALVEEAFSRLEAMHSQLPQHRLRRWVNLGITIAALAASPLLFYYLFPRLYALIWAYMRRNWIVRRVKNGSR